MTPSLITFAAMLAVSVGIMIALIALEMPSDEHRRFREKRSKDERRPRHDRMAFGCKVTDGTAERSSR